jgi:hypothetical protein
MVYHINKSSSEAHGQSKSKFILQYYEQHKSICIILELIFERNCLGKVFVAYYNLFLSIFSLLIIVIVM